MNIDWFTFTAQIINFLVLVALLRWVLYGRVVKAMNEREEKITSRLEEADRKESQAAEEAEKYRQKQSELESKREELLSDAREDAREKKEELIKEAREEVASKRAEWEKAYQRQRDNFLDDLREQAGSAGLEAARHILQQLANAELESEMCEAFIQKLEHLNSDQRQKVKDHLEDHHSSARVRSSFEMKSDQKETLRDAIRDVFETEAEIQFEQEENLICGLELNIGGYTLGWNIREFLTEMEMDFDQHLKSTENKS